MLFVGIIIGALLGIAIMCLVQVNRDNSIENDRDYWEHEARKWHTKMEEIRQLVEGGTPDENKIH